MPLKQFQPPLFKFFEQLVICLVLMMAMINCTCQAQSESKPWSNPVLLYGSNFGEVFQQLYLTSKYDLMLNLTSQGNRQFYGDSAILAYYKQMQFAYPIKLVSHNRDGNKYQLFYKAYINATVHKIIMDIIVEHDTARLVLPPKFYESKYHLLGIH